jgi:RNA polymerase sigma-70 factor, ECF subfamily
MRSNCRIISSSGVVGGQWTGRSLGGTYYTEARRMTGCSDQAIVERVRQGDAEAFGLLVQKYQDRIYSTILNYVRNVEEAADLAQETFVKGYSGLSKFNGKSAFYTWLYRIAVNTAIDHLRKRPSVRVDSLQDDRFRETGFEPAAGKSSDPQHALATEEERRFLREAISSLSDKLRTALILHDVEGLSQEEIADVLKCPIGTVKSRVSRARCEVRALLAEYLERL